MEQFASPIQIPIERDDALDRWLASTFMLTCGTVIWIAGTTVPGVLIAATIVAGFGYHRYHASRLVAGTRAIMLGTDDHWSVISHDGEVRSAELLPGLFLSRVLVIVRLKPDRGQPLHIVLTRANTRAPAFRRLRVRLRLPMGDD